MRFRFLPFMIYFSAFILLMKLVDIVDKTKTLSAIFGVIELNAEQSQTTPEQAVKNAESSPKTESSTTKKPDNSTIQKSFISKDNNPIQCSASELEVLRSLSKRREELNAWRQDLVTKESMLKAAEFKVSQKIGELEALKKTVSGLLDEYNKKEDMKISSLVKIYENMKPKDAAKIFEGLEMNILLQVLDKMKEAKTAPILAQMDPAKATELTTQFAKQKKLPQNAKDNGQ
jgi:flagellar motility protein MotE (MotC chaperone)